jgi:DNA polymerase I-like protein with 3'-5' exonuclease and polymerase domains
MITTIDCETTTKNKGHPFTPGNFLVSYSFKVNNEATVFKYFTEPDFITTLRDVVANATLLVGFNIKFDIHWFRNLGITIPDQCSIFDCSLAEFLITGQTAVMVSLDEVLASYGLEAKQDKVKEYWELGIDTPDIPLEVLEEYNNQDVNLTYLLYLEQLKLLNEKLRHLTLLEGFDLLTLVEAERNGILFDTETCLKEMESLSQALHDVKAQLHDFLPEFPHEFNWESGDQLSALLYGGDISYDFFTESPAIYKSGPREGENYVKRSWHTHKQNFPKRFEPLKGTAVKKCLVEGYSGTMFYQVDDPTLKQLKSRRHEDKKLLECLDKVAKTGQVLKMLTTVMKHFKELEWENNLVHGQYNQNIAATGRLSASKPNLQNTPPELDALLISRYG